jgi:hypothetical protein
MSAGNAHGPSHFSTTAITSGANASGLSDLINHYVVFLRATY